MIFLDAHAPSRKTHAPSSKTKRNPPSRPLASRTLSVALILLGAGLLGGASNEAAATFARPRILVWNLQTAGVKKVAATSVAASVTRWASKNPHLEVISHADLGQLLQIESTRLELGLPEDGRLQEIATKADAALVIFGKVTRATGRKGGYSVHLSLFEAKTARAVHREKVHLADLARLDEDLGRAANAMVGRVLENPALDSRQAAAVLVENIPSRFLTERPAERPRRGRKEAPSKIVVAPFTYGSSRFTSPFGKTFARDVKQALSRRGRRLTLDRGHKLIGSYRVNHDMVELVLAIKATAKEEKRKQRGKKRGKKGGMGWKSLGGKEIFQSQVRLIRATVDAATLTPTKLSEVERRRFTAGMRENASSPLRLDAWTEKGRLDVVFAEGESFHVYLKMNQPGYVRMIYVFAKRKGQEFPTKVLMEDAWPLTAEQVGKIVRYPLKFGPAPPFGVERIEVVGSVTRPEALETVSESIDGQQYDVVLTGRGFVRDTDSKALITITTTAR